MTPELEGFRWPAEWEPHAATWLVWPHNPETWPGQLSRIPAVFARMVQALLSGERVEILVRHAADQAGAEKVLAEHHALGASVGFHQIPTNDSWIRDYGPIFLQGPHGEGRVLDWDYNAWGGKYMPWAEDAGVAARVATLLAQDRVTPGHILEGGSVEGDGLGTVLTTESCLLHENRNPDLDRRAVESMLEGFLGAEKILWLGEGIVGDDTDGHVDNLTRFVGHGTVVTVMEENPADANYRSLHENFERLSGMRDARGESIEVITLPMPAPLRWGDVRLPASYANFYIGNGAVLVPTFRDPRDAQVLGLFGELFPDRAIVGIEAIDLVVGLGACHCLTQQQPSLPSLAP